MSKCQELLSTHVLQNKKLHEVLLGIGLGVAGTLLFAEVTGVFKTDEEERRRKVREEVAQLIMQEEKDAQENEDMMTSGQVARMMMTRKEHGEAALEDEEEVQDEEPFNMSLADLREAVRRERQARFEAEERLASQQERRRKMEVDLVDQINAIRKEQASLDGEIMDSEEDSEGSVMASEEDSPGRNNGSASSSDLTLFHRKMLNEAKMGAETTKATLPQKVANLDTEFSTPVGHLSPATKAGA